MLAVISKITVLSHLAQPALSVGLCRQQLIRRAQPHAQVLPSSVRTPTPLTVLLSGLVTPQQIDVYARGPANMGKVLFFLIVFLSSLVLGAIAVFHTESDEAVAQIYCDCIAATVEPPTPTSGGEA